MKFFIDTANLDQIREAYDMGVLDGVTTNPSLMAKEGIKGVENQRKHYVDICNIVQGDVSAEVIATDYEGMIKEGEELAALKERLIAINPRAPIEVADMGNVPIDKVIDIYGFNMNDILDVDPTFLTGAHKHHHAGWSKTKWESSVHAPAHSVLHPAVLRAKACKAGRGM